MSDFPRIGASYLENLVGTLLLHGNAPEDLNLETIARDKPFSADDILEQFKIQQNGGRKLPEEIAATAPKAISREEDEE